MSGREECSGNEVLVPTGISGLDRLLGGFPRGALVLLAGNPGTGKSTIAAKFLYEGARRGEPGIYVNFVETKRDFMTHMRTLGMDLEALERKGLFHYMEALTIVDEDSLVAQLEKVLQRVAETGAKRLVIDSVTAMLQIIRDRARIRELVQNFFVTGVKPLGVTTILIAEHPYGAKMVGYGIEEFIVDAVMILRFEITQGKIKRIMELRKARWAPIRQAEIPFYIRPGVVVELSLPEAPEEVPPLDLTNRINLAEAVASFTSKTPAWLIRTKLSHSHELGATVFTIPRGAQIVLGHYPTIDSKHILSLLSAILLHQYGLRVTIVSSKSSPTAFRNLATCILGLARGRGEARKLVDKNLSVASFNPTAYTLTEIYDAIRTLLDNENPDLFILEGVDILEAFADRNEYQELLYNLMLRNKRRRITSIYTFSTFNREDLYRRMAASMADIAVYIAEPHLAPEEQLGGQSYAVEFAGLFGRTEAIIVLNSGLLYQNGCIG